MTLTLVVDPAAPDEASIARAAAVILSGQLVAFPTETVYGLGANALDETAVRRIFLAKRRPATNPLIVHVGSVAQARHLAHRWPREAAVLADAFWPGPLTLVVPRGERVPAVVSAGLSTFGVRMPAHPVALALIEAAGVPLAAPSANRYTQVSPTRAQHVEASLGDAVDVILDGGPTQVGIESTVVSVGDRVEILRPGMIGREAIEAALGAEVILRSQSLSDDVPRDSPGQAMRHYSPRATVILASPDAGSPTSGWVSVGPAARDFPGRVIELPPEPQGFARELYAALHDLDALECDVIYVGPVPDGPGWEAIRDRLARSASV